jgi:anti-sigma B factor antagonist
MDVELREQGDVVVVALDGRLVAGVGDVVLNETMNQLVADGWTKILLDMSSIQRVDSAGIGELMASRKLAQRFGSELRLMNVVGQVHRVLELGQLLPLFRIYADEAEALADFASDAD